MAKKSEGWGRVFVNLLTIIPSIFNIVSHLLSCLEYEAHLAKRSLIMLFVLALVAITLMISGWLCLSAMAFVWLQMHLSTLVSLGILFGGHVVLLIIVGMWMAITKNDLFFNRTRELFHRED